MKKDELIKDTNINPESFTDKFKKLSQRAFFSTASLITILIILKTSFQLLLLSSGFRWLSADDFCRTVKSYEWLQSPEISSGVWLTPHFWINGFSMLLIKDLFTAATVVSLVFTALALVFFYKVVELCFDKKTAFISSLIFCFFPFQVWLSISGLPESIFFFFAIAGIYYFIKWKAENTKTSYLLLSAVLFALSNVFRYEGWLFSASLVILVLSDITKEKKISKTIVN
nr:glycosyltransferase family 39 protein [Bacteroidota bacterium]